MKTKRAWIVAFATIFAGISLALVQNKVAPCMTTLMGAFNIDMATAGWLSSLFSLVGIVMAIPASIVLNKLGPKKGGIVALACAILGSLIGVFTDSVPVLMASRIVEGVGVGLMSVIGPSLIGHGGFPEAKRGPAHEHLGRVPDWAPRLSCSSWAPCSPPASAGRAYGGSGLLRASSRSCSTSSA